MVSTYRHIPVMVCMRRFAAEAESYHSIAATLYLLRVIIRSARELSEREKRGNVRTEVNNGTVRAEQCWCSIEIVDARVARLGPSLGMKKEQLSGGIDDTVIHVQ